MIKWDKLKLNKIIVFNPPESIRKGTIVKKIAMKQILPFTRKIQDYDMESFNGGTKFRNGDTLVARITPCLENGKTAQVSILNGDEIGFGSTEFIVLREIPNVSDKNYIFYLSKSDIFRAIAIKSMVGSSGRQRVQMSVLEESEFSIPPFEEQKKIGSILSSIDNKIEMNNKINMNLLQQATIVFDQFYSLGKDKKIDSLLDSIESGSRQKGGSISEGIPSIGAEKIDSFGKYDFSKEKYISKEYFQKMKRGIVKSGDVLLYKDGAYTGKSSMALNGFPHKVCAVNEHVFIIRTKDNFAKFFIYFCLSKKENIQKIFSLASAKAAQPGLNRNELRSIIVKIPSVNKIVELVKEFIKSSK